MVPDSSFNFFFQFDNRYLFEIPPFQRGYSWNNKRVSEFMKDLERTDADSQSTHFFGTIYTCLSKNPNKPYHIRLVDGQQRVTTAAIFLICCRDYFYELQDDSPPAKDYFERAQRLLYKLHQDTHLPDTTRFILIPSRTNKRFFDDYLVPLKPICEKLKMKDFAMNDSDEFLADAYKTIYQYIRSYAPNASKITNLNQMIWTLLEQGKLIRIEVDDEAKAYLMFDLINNRGIKLTQSDLVKNRLFGELSSELKDGTDLEDRIDDYDEKWAGIRDNVTGRTTGSVTLDNFFLQYLIAFQPETRNPKRKDVFDTFAERLKSRQSTAIINDLQEWSKKFVYLRRPDNHFKAQSDAYHYLKKINAINAINVYSVLLSGYKNYWENDDKTSFTKLTKLCFIYHVRTKSLRAGMLLENYETKLNQLALMLNERPIPSIHKLVKTIIADEQAYPSNAKIMPQLEALKPKNSNFAKALLEEIERSIDPDKVSSSDVTAEHILPHDTKYWDSYIIENHSDIRDKADVEAMHGKYCNLLGNQTLLRKPKNRRVSNREFDFKKDIYKDDGHHITRELKSVNKWTKKEIDRRQKKFSKKLLELLDLTHFAHD